MANQYNPYSSQYTSPSYMSQQQFFPTPQGSVYQINNTLEVANVPAGQGLTVALCLSEGLMYIKSIQNGQPMFWAYKMVPYVEEEKKIDGKLEERLSAIEQRLSEIIQKPKKEVSF